MGDVQLEPWYVVAEVRCCKVKAQGIMKFCMLELNNRSSLTASRQKHSFQQDLLPI
jgi:hypothetical protein